MQFYKVELGEQRRLQGIMDHHSRNPGDAVSANGRGFGYVSGATARDYTPGARGDLMEVSSDSDGQKHGSSAGGKTPGPMSFSRGSSGATGGSEASGDYFPYSITAGLEKGGKNRCVCILLRFLPVSIDLGGTIIF